MPSVKLTTWGMQRTLSFGDLGGNRNFFDSEEFT